MVSHRLLRPDGRPSSSLWWVPRECLPTSREPLPQAVGSLWASSEPPARPYVCLAGRRVPVLVAKRLEGVPPVWLNWLAATCIYTMCDGFRERIADLRRSGRSPKIARTSSQTEPKPKKYKIYKNSTRRVTSHIPLLYRPAARFSSCCRCLLYTLACVQSKASTAPPPPPPVFPPTLGASKSRP